MKSILQKNYALVILILCIGFSVVFFGRFFLTSRDVSAIGEQSEEKFFEELSIDEPIDIATVEINDIREGSGGELFIENKGQKRKVEHDGRVLSSFHFSPSKRSFGFIEHFDMFDKKIPWERQVIIHVGDSKTRLTKEVYRGSHRTSGWEWQSERGILVSYGCGTECQVLYLIDTETGERTELQYGVGYTWSPDKKMVLAYHYSGGSGITVGDTRGNKLFTFDRRAHEYGSELQILTKAFWSSDSTKIALVIKKENGKMFELLIFDVRNNFEQIFQADIGAAENIRGE